MNSIFIQRNIPFSLRTMIEHITSVPKTSKYGTETVRYRAAIIWIPNELKNSK